MRQILIICAVCFATALSALATSVESPVTPDNLDQSNYKFSVTTTPTKTEIGFHITIASKNEDISADSNAGLSVVTHTKDRQGSFTGTSISPFTPAVAVTLQKQKRTWTADFSLPRKSLKTDGLCLVFSELAHTTIDGKLITMPSVTFYEIKLKDFVKE